MDPVRLTYRVFWLMMIGFVLEAVKLILLRR